MSIGIYECNDIKLEKKTHQELARYSYGSELYYSCYLDDILEYLSNSFKFITTISGKKSRDPTHTFTELQETRQKIEHFKIRLSLLEAQMQAVKLSKLTPLAN
jgi:hypothetical protein